VGLKDEHLKELGLKTIGLRGKFYTALEKLTDSPGHKSPNWVVSPLPDDLSRIRPPRLSKDAPEFVCEEGWLSKTKEKILDGFRAGDSGDGSFRVPPLALIRHTRGGKTRSLYELMRVMDEHFLGVANSPVLLFITFNDFANLSSWEIENPLKAVCHRISFSAFHQGDFSTTE